MNKLLRFSTLLFFSFMLMNSTSVQAADPALTDNQGAAIPDANVINPSGKSGNSNSGISFSNNSNDLYLMSVPKNLEFGEHGQFTILNWNLIPQKDQNHTSRQANKGPQDDGVAVADFRLGKATNWYLSVQSTAFYEKDTKALQPIAAIGFRNAEMYNGQSKSGTPLDADHDLNVADILNDVVYEKADSLDAYAPVKKFDKNQAALVYPPQQPTDKNEAGKSVILLTSADSDSTSSNDSRGRGLWLLAFDKKEDIVLYPTKSEIVGTFIGTFYWNLGTDATQALS